MDHIHRVIPKSLPALCKMATADDSDITVNGPSDNFAGCRLSWYTADICRHEWFIIGWVDSTGKINGINSVILGGSLSLFFHQK